MGEHFKQKIWSVGYQYYRPIGLEHHKLLELHKFNIGMHMGWFLLDIGKLSKSKEVVDL